jgi:hypothetical protein
MPIDWAIFIIACISIPPRFGIPPPPMPGIPPAPIPGIIPPSPGIPAMPGNPSPPPIIDSMLGMPPPRAICCILNIDQAVVVGAASERDFIALDNDKPELTTTATTTILTWP